MKGAVTEEKIPGKEHPQIISILKSQGYLGVRVH